MKDKQTIIIWDNNSQFIDEVRKYFEPVILVSSISELQEYIDKKQPIEKIVILAELTIDGKKGSDLYGLDIVQMLRLNNKITAPILVFSFMPESFFISSGDPTKKGNILKAPAHKFIQLPCDFKNEVLITQDSLDEDLLEDINFAFFDLHGIASEILHDLPNKLDSIESRGKDPELLFMELKPIIENSFEKLSTLIESNELNKLQNIKNTLFDELKKDIEKKIGSNQSSKRGDQYKNSRTIIKLFSGQIYAMLPESTEVERKTNSPGKTRWEVLYIDDDESNLLILSEYFSTKDIVCHTAISAADAFNILENDKAGKIKIVITDIRLLDGNTKWQSKQGYQILKKLNKEHPFPLGYFVLTSKMGTIIKSIQKKSEFTIQWYDKKDVLTSETGFNSFFSVVIKRGDEIYFLSKSQPKIKVWTTGNSRIKCPLSIYYKVYIESSDYEEQKKEINKMAEAFIKNYERKVENEILELTLTHEKIDFQEAFMKKFTNNILVGRRVAIGLHCMGYSGEQIFKALKPDYETEDAEDPQKAVLSSMKQLFPTSLALSMNLSNDIPKSVDVKLGKVFECNILEEEVDFINANFEADISIAQIRLNSDDLDSLREIFRQFEHFLIHNKGVLTNYFEKDLVDSLTYQDIIDTLNALKKIINKNITLKSEFTRIIRPEMQNMTNPAFKKIIEAMKLE
jgi:CheY-like chemotaxis protein